MSDNNGDCKSRGLFLWKVTLRCECLNVIIQVVNLLVLLLKTLVRTPGNAHVRATDSRLLYIFSIFVLISTTLSNADALISSSMWCASSTAISRRIFRTSGNARVRATDLGKSRLLYIWSIFVLILTTSSNADALISSSMWRGSSTAISRRIFKLLNDQGNREFENSLTYTAFSHWFDYNELPGSASWCKTQAQEERGHALKILEHLSSRRIEDDVTGSEWETQEAERLQNVRGTNSNGDVPTESSEASEREPDLGKLRSEAAPQKSKTFHWEQVPNIVLDVKGPFTTTFSDPIAIWRKALEQERYNSRKIFQIMAAARETQDYVTESLLMSYYIPEQLGEEKAVEEVLSNTLLVMKRGPEFYYELDRSLPSKPH
ncbi:ferritin [Nannochloropsis gaditana]|uniref:Ferritin n=2 Tax=Nannochloropsis gaditana TaxID=72520 RepID=W7T0U3_9STRA|nr:ferritin [Nannochloropsis gaditana]